MALTEETVIDRIEILADGRMQVREASIIKRDGVEITKAYTRKVVEVDEDVAAEDARIKAVAAAVWDDATKAKRLAKVNEDRVGRGEAPAQSMREANGR